MIKSRSIVYILIAPLLSVAAIALYKHIPDRTLQVMSSPDSRRSLYADSRDGGESEAYWLDQTNGLWACKLREGLQYPFCGISAVPGTSHSKGLDLTLYDSLNLHITYTGPAKKIRLYLRDYDATMADKLDGYDGKFMSVQLNTSDLNRPINIELNEFTVADWWIDHYELTREQSRPEFANIVNIGLDFANPYPFGDHEIRIINVELVGKRISAEQWYLGIITLWLVGAFAVALMRWLALYRAGQENLNRIDELNELNRKLKTRSAELENLSKSDPLTGTLNRLGFTAEIDRFLNSTASTKTASLALFSIDQFKNAKEHLGLANTDDFLQNITDVIQSHARADHVLARWDSDEFVMLCPDTDTASAFVMVENIRKILSAWIQEKSKRSSVTICASICELGVEGGFITAFQDLDTAIAKAKSIGGNCTIMG
jgi:diguanylate cyclase (GGDEF) domain